MRLLLPLVALFIGCSDDVPPGPMFCEADCMEYTADFRVEAMDGMLIPVVADTSVPVIQGFQGGVMIRPAAILSDLPVERGEEVEVRVELSPVVESEFGQFERITNVRTSPDGLMVGPFDDQIAWDPPDGFATELSIRVRGLDWVARASAPVTLVE